MVKGRRFVLKHHFDGQPKKEDFELVDEELPPLKDGEILFRSLFISVDPYQRPYSASFELPTTMIGSSLAIVEESKDSNFEKGSHILVYSGWVERGICNPTILSRDSQFGGVMKLAEIPGISLSYMLGSCGAPGNTAYFGLLEICQPRPGETVVVTTAAGAVGSLVGQIAKIKGCNVIGFAGDDSKVAWLKEIGFDHAFNYKKVNISECLKEAAPKGVDCYFDNVGGKMSSQIISAMNSRGRVSVCGAISQYCSKDGPTIVEDVLPLCIFKELKIEGFLVTRWADRWMEGVQAMANWIKEDKIKVKETVVEGFENTPEAFIGLFTGSNVGKMIVKL